MDIYEFKPGDTIMRVTPSTTGDRSYIGNKCTLVGVYSGVIFLYTPHIRRSSDPHTLACDKWQYGWELWPTAEIAEVAEMLQKENQG